ncbi:hypothetical protein GCM10011579_086700 [Streptomyces albiflavescens]|uniref:Uncharacterized protein n=1 Tax=Streptomyces albiflavescens TaxID=1623582 RepID=A0A918DA99_9ACTN|nr:hypothetical protein [Streptomyces albiflavescens]GGN90626.1 hypothetical protein GCM10011579_086700 [Streptomyces albiflavescens]
MNSVVIASVASALALALRGLGRRRSGASSSTGRSFSPLVALAVTTVLIYVNQVLFTVYVLRVHGGDPSFIARYLPTGWFDLATHDPMMRSLGRVLPAPELLATSVLRVQAFLELPFVLTAFATVARWFDADLYRRIACSALLPLASVSYTVVFCLVEWDLRNPYTNDDLVIRAVSAVITPVLLARWAARDAGVSRAAASVSGLLVFIGSLGALGVLVLVVYDTALLYNLGRLDDRLPVVMVAVAALTGLRWAAGRLPDPSAPGLSSAFVWQVLRHWLGLFLVPALAVRYGVMFGTPQLAGAMELLMAAVAVVLAGRDVVVTSGGGRRLALVLAGRVGCAVLAGSAAAYGVAALTPRSYYEVTLLSAAAAFLVTGVAVCGLLDAGARCASAT